MPQFPPSLEDARRMFALLARPGDVFELRGLKRVQGQQHTTSGYFDDVEALVKAAASRSGDDVGVYVTINPVDPALLARAPKNRLRRVGSGDTTGDRDVRRRRSILIDVDPVRPAGISSTDGEHEAALELARAIRASLRDGGWPEPILADSGNGGHLIYAVDLPVDDGGLVRRVLAEASRRWTTPALKVDEKVFNPARISKIYGTLTRKGEDTPERPHRLARILEAPDALVEVPSAALEAFAPESNGMRELRGKVDAAGARHPAYRPNGDRPEFDLDAWIARHLPDAKERPWSEGRRWIIPVCPFDDQHDRGEAFVTQKHGGSIAAGCQHESCFKSWRQLRERFEPDAYASKANGPGISHREPPPEVLYEDARYAAELDAFAARDREPDPAPRAPERPPWRRAPELVDEIWARKDDPWVSLQVGQDELARVRAGGIAVVIGGSGSGKSSLVSNLLIRHARDTGPAIALSIELPADELAARIVGIKCDASWEDALSGRVPREHMAEALALPRLYVLEREHATIANLRACVRAARAEHPGQPILVAIDYAQLIESDEREARLRVADAFKRIDRAARDERVVVIAVSQMSRAGAREAREGDRIGAAAADLGAETAAIERFATVTLTIGMKGEAREDGSEPVELSIGKARMSGGDSVRRMSYWGRSGLWRAEGDAKPAAVVRKERDAEKADKEKRSLENQLIGAVTAAKHPLSRNELQELVVGGRRDAKMRAIADLIARGELVEVNRRAPRSRSWMIWTEANAASNGLQLVRDTLFGGDR